LQVATTGLLSMMLMLLTGVTGPLLDTMFLRSPLERRQIIATKASCQVFGHAFKLIYFGAVIDQGGSAEPWLLALAVVSSMIGTSLGKQILERLSDLQFLTWSNRIVTTIATYYVGYGLVLLAGVAKVDVAEPGAPEAVADVQEEALRWGNDVGHRRSKSVNETRVLARAMIGVPCGYCPSLHPSPALSHMTVASPADRKASRCAL